MYLNIDEHKRESIGIVIIGRNEGERLRRAFDSLPLGCPSIYVDSGSTDGSQEMARSRGISLHILDPGQPYSAARARCEGFERLIEKHPALDKIQFVDGDCAMIPGWVEKAGAYLEQNPGVGIVCGLLTEAAPMRSIYNRFNALRWKAVAGDIEACGGIFMIRRLVYKAAGGFNAALHTGEESGLCLKVKKAGHRIVQLNEKMAQHDADLIKFADWWNRAVWGGYGDALQYYVLKGEVPSKLRHETRSIYIWTVCAPSLGLLGGLGTIWSNWALVLPFLCSIGYSTLFVKIVFDRRRRGDAARDAALYAFFCILRKFPNAVGYFRYWLR